MPQNHSSTFEMFCTVTLTNELSEVVDNIDWISPDGFTFNSTTNEDRTNTTNAVSPKPKRHCPPKLVCMLVTSIPTCMKFLSRFQLIKFFDDHGQKGKFGCFCR